MFAPKKAVNPLDVPVAPVDPRGPVDPVIPF